MKALPKFLALFVVFAIVVFGEHEIYQWWCVQTDDRLLQMARFIATCVLGLPFTVVGLNCLHRGFSQW